jgi:hypothetical protein
MPKTPNAERVQSLVAEYADGEAGARRLAQAFSDSQEKLTRNRLLADTGVQFSAENAEKLAKETERLEQFATDSEAAIMALAAAVGHDTSKYSGFKFDPAGGLSFMIKDEPVVRAGSDEVGKALAEFSRIVTSHQIGRVVVPEVYGPKFAVSTANAGAVQGVSHTPAVLSPYLTDLAGIALEMPPGAKVGGPLWGALDPQAAPSEGGAVPELADPTLSTATIGFYSRVSTLSAAVERFGNGQGNAGNRLRAEVIGDVNRAFVTDAVSVAGAAMAFVTGATAPSMVDRGIARVSTLAGERPGLIVCNETDYPLLSERSATSGADIGAPVLAFNGVALAVENGVPAGNALVIAGNGWTAYRDGMELVSAPIITTGQIAYRANQWAGVKPEFSGAAVLVDLAA